MARKARIIINLGKMLLLALIPILLVIKFRWDAILPVIIYLQLLLIWAQTEIGLRQHLLFSAQFDPSFDVKLKEGALIANEKEGGIRHYNIYITNTSKYPAYNVMIGRILDEQNYPISPNIWKNKILTSAIYSLTPGKDVLLGSIVDKSFFENNTIEINYTNLFGEWKEIWIKFLSGRPLVIPKGREAPGILLNTFEELILFLKFIKFQHSLKSLRKQKLH